MQEDQRRCGCTGCAGKVESRFNGVWYCNKHYLRMRAHGDLELHPRQRTTRLIDDGGDAVTIMTASGKEILIDRGDIDKAMRYSWCISKTGYPVARINNRVVKMHRYLLGLTSGDKVVDHINGNPLDNRRANLRVCSTLENAWNIGLKKTNTSGCAGIRKTPNNTYNVRITVNRKEIHVGNYKTLDDAVRARKQAEQTYYGEFAPQGMRNTIWEMNSQ